MWSPKPALAVGGAVRTGLENQAGTRVPRWGLGGSIRVNGVFLCAHQSLQFCAIDSIWTRLGCCPLSSLLWRSSASESVSSSSQRPQGG